MIDMIAKILLLGLLASAVLAIPIGPGDDDDDIPTYTEKVVPNKPTQVPKFGTKKIATLRHVPEKSRSEKKHPHATLLPKAILKTSKPIRGSTRPVRRTNKVQRNPDHAYNDLNPSYDYDAPAPIFVPVQDLGVEYATEVAAPGSHRDDSLVDDYEPRRVHKRPFKAPRKEHYKASAPSAEARTVHQVDVTSDYGSAVGNAPQLRYAPAPERFASAAAQARDVPDYGYSGNSYEDKPQPYIFGYELKDENGSTQSRKEQGDDYGNKRGSYGYTDGYGIYRQVDYVADAHGFRAVIKTNEPGTENQDPADVEMQSEAQKY